MNDDLKDLIASTMDVTQFLDIIGYELVDLIALLDEEIENYKPELERACR